MNDKIKCGSCGEMIKRSEIEKHAKEYHFWDDK